jgi:hypothetical protein
VKGDFEEFTLAEVLQLFAMAEKSGVIDVYTDERHSRLFLDAGQVTGWGLDHFNVHAAVLKCELLPVGGAHALETVVPTHGDPGIGFIVRNLVEPHRWEWFTQRLLENDIYPILTAETGEFDVTVKPGATSPVALNLSVQQLILDGSRWEADVGELAQDGYRLNSTWQRRHVERALERVDLSQSAWLTWAALNIPSTIRDLGRRLCVPDIEAARAVKLLHLQRLIERAR